METTDKCHFTWKDWIKIIPGIILLLIITGSFSAWLELSPACRGCACGVCMVIAWAVYYLQRERRPLLAETAALLGVLVWMYAQTMYIDEIRLKFSPELIPLVKNITMAGMASVVILPLLTRQRLIVLPAMGALYLLLDLLTNRLSCTTNSYLAGCCSMGLWMLSERWRTTGSKYRCYAWVGLPAWLLLWVFFLPSTYQLGYAAVAPILFLLLRPQGGWQLSRTLIAATCLLPALLIILESHISAPLMALYTLILIREGMLTRQPRFVVLGCVLLFFTALIIASLCLPHSYVSVAAVGFELAACTAIILMWRRLARRTPEPPAASPCAPFPAARWQLILVGVVVVAQLGWLGVLVCDNPGSHFFKP